MQTRCGGLTEWSLTKANPKNHRNQKPETKKREIRISVGSTFKPTKFNVEACNKELGKLNKYIKEYGEGF